MNPIRTFLVVGSGSIARRHISNLKKLFNPARVLCVSATGRVPSQEEIGADTVVYRSIEQALSEKLEFAIVASPAPFHISQAALLLESNVPVLIEKPLSDSMNTFKSLGAVLHDKRGKVEVAYNLRLMPSAIKFKSLITEGMLGDIYNVIIDVGQYLPDWRPTSDYKKNVSAQKALGGGVLLELSHELDYLGWIFGIFDTAFCAASNSGALEIDVEDSVDAILINKKGLVANLHMDFLQRSPARTCKVIGQYGTLIWDILQNSVTLKDNNSQTVIFIDAEYDRNSMYLDELVNFSKVAAGRARPSVDIDQALSTLSLIEALKHSAANRQVVNIGDFLL
ncbi:Gfo/Idh/MocA family protein [Pseudomonas sp. LB3P81]